MKILLIEDEESIASAIRQGLEEAHYTVTWTPNGQTGYERASEESFSLIILDLMLPGRDGWAVCRDLRARRITTPILMLTARDAVDDRVKGLELGADDYLPKPFDFAELLARVRALMRREAVHKGRTLRIGDLEVDTKERRARRGGDDIPLTGREYSLLEALAMREGRTLTREFILESVWSNEESLPNTVDVFIGMLRRKIDYGRDIKLIQTVHGMGYCLREPAPPKAAA